MEDEYVSQRVASLQGDEPQRFHRQVSRCHEGPRKVKGLGEAGQLRFHSGYSGKAFKERVMSALSALLLHKYIKIVSTSL